MQLLVLKSKIHNALVTEANINYVGSITIDEDLMDEVDIIEGEQVHVVNHRNGERLITYVIKGERGTGKIGMNGPAALKISKSDKVIIMAYALMTVTEGKKYKPKIVFPKGNNSI